MKSFLKILGFILMPVLLIGLIYLISPKFRNYLSPFIEKLKGFFKSKKSENVETTNSLTSDNIIKK